MANTTNEAVFNQVAYATINDTSSLTVADGVFTASFTTNLSSTNCESRPLGSMRVTATFSTAPAAANKTLDLKFRYINIDGVNDEPALDSDFTGHHRKSMLLDAATGVTTHRYLIENIVLPKPNEEVECYFLNNSGQTLTAFKVDFASDSLIPYAA